MAIKLYFYLHSNCPSYNRRIVIEDLGHMYGREEWWYDHRTTLRDIAILLYEGCGQGVMWNLSRELAKALKVDKQDVENALEDIISRYATMSRKAAEKKYNKLGTYIESKKEI